MTFSLRTLLAATAFAAIFMAGLIYRSPIWASIVVTMTLAIFIVATCGLILKPKIRFFNVPFCMTGCIYLAVVFLPFLSDVHRFLYTTRLVGSSYALLKEGQPPQFYKNTGTVNLRLDTDTAVNFAVGPYASDRSGYYPELRSFFHIGDCLSAIVSAFILATGVGYWHTRLPHAET